MTVFSPHLSTGFETVYYSFILAVLPCFSSLDITPFVCLISQWLFHLCLFCCVSQLLNLGWVISDFFFPICIESLGDNILHSGFKCHLYVTAFKFIYLRPRPSSFLYNHTFKCWLIIWMSYRQFKINTYMLSWTTLPVIPISNQHSPFISLK